MQVFILGEKSRERSCMDRKEKILKHIDLSGEGIEIGPGYNPVVPKREGFKVHSIDHMCKEDLVRKYSVHQVDTENIEDVDFVWHGEPYAELTGKKNYYDWIIASHLIEHTPDLIGFLNDCDTIIKDTGVISLVIPDKRYCFDHFRPITSIARIIDSHLQKNTNHTPGTAVEYYLNSVLKGGVIAWSPCCSGEYEPRHSLEEAVAEFESGSNGKDYVDFHNWCFVPHSFRLMIHDLYNLGLIPFKEVDFYLTEGHEFFAVLGRQGRGVGISRLEMLKIIESEVRV
jgi:Methyltransferase domain